jgi:aspartokinase/homoserine dehydrogenase 1
MQGSVEDFYHQLTEYEDHFKSLLSNAQRQGKILKYTADFENGKASRITACGF